MAIARSYRARLVKPAAVLEQHAQRVQRRDEIIIRCGERPLGHAHGIVQGDFRVAIAPEGALHAAVSASFKV